MGIRIYTNPVSQHARRVHMAALELGLDVEWKLVDFRAGEHQQPPYLAINPHGKVPTLEEDSFVLWESNAIMAYLADKRPAAGLYPTDAHARADVNRWLFWESAHFGRACITLTWERMFKPIITKQPSDPVMVADGELQWRRFAKVLDDHLRGRAYVAGVFSIADLALASITMYRHHANIDTSPFPQLEAWLGRIEARDSWKQTQPPI
jgi:glutathione S-transferase